MVSDGDLERIVAVLPPGRTVVLIDGRSGSGKTELGAALASLQGSQLIRLDDLYPGWGGLEAASRMVSDDILDRNRWQRWDWTDGRSAAWNAVDPSRSVVIEGSGSLSRASRARATFGIWVELDEPTRKARALARDGAMYEPHWDEWAEQEQRFFERERPDLLADLVL